MSGRNSAQIHELMHRLQALEADLHEAAKSRVVTDADYTARLDRLRLAMQQSKHLKNILSATTINNPIRSQVDLPVMGDYSRMEQKIVSRFVLDTKAYTSELAVKIRRASEWGLDAANGLTGIISLVWRLSWLRGQIRRIDQDIESVRKARGVVEDFISRTSISGKEPNSRANQKDLIAAFQEFESATGRVTALKARLRGEIARNADMRDWLNDYFEKRRQKNPEKIPPEPQDVSEIAKSMSDRLTGGAKLANERLVIARQLAEALGATPINVDSAQNNLNAPTSIKKSKNTGKGARL